MSDTSIDWTFGRRAFGRDPAGYDAARPAYPDWVFEVLRARGLAPGAAVFEIGAGTGIATRRLLALGARPLVAVEPDDRLATFLRTTVPDDALSVVVAPFEDAVLPPAGFDVGFSATAFHWLPEDLALAKVAALLRPGGTWAMVWNVFADANRPDPFHDATQSLFAAAPRPSRRTDADHVALDAGARIAAIERTGAFDEVEHRARAWSLVLDPDQTVALYASYSTIDARPDREAVLAELRRVARDQFGGRVIRNMITSLYVARRRT